MNKLKPLTIYQRDKLIHSFMNAKSDDVVYRRFSQKITEDSFYKSKLHDHFCYLSMQIKTEEEAETILALNNFYGNNIPWLCENLTKIKELALFRSNVAIYYKMDVSKIKREYLFNSKIFSMIERFEINPFTLGILAAKYKIKVFDQDLMNKQLLKRAERLLIIHGLARLNPNSKKDNQNERCKISSRSRRSLFA